MLALSVTIQQWPRVAEKVSKSSGVDGLLPLIAIFIKGA